MNKIIVDINDICVYYNLFILFIDNSLLNKIDHDINNSTLLVIRLNKKRNV